MPRRPYATNRMSNPAGRMMMLRQWHSYIGAFIAPSVLFFALTGTLQLFSLHEAHDGYTPPPLIEKLASVHKDQVFKPAEHHHDPDAGDAKKGPGPDAKAGPPAAEAKAPDTAQIRIWVLKWVFAIVALGLVVSTLLGLWMAFTSSRRKAVVAVLFLAGAAAPILLIAL